MVNVSRDDADNQLQLRCVVEHRQGYSDNIKKGDVTNAEPGVGSRLITGLTVVVTCFERSGEGQVAG